MVTSEPMGTMAWMPLNDHTRVKPTYDIYDTVTKGKVAIGNGRLVSTGDNAPDANFPNGSTSWHWKSSEPVAAYLVENSIGTFDWSERVGGNGVLYYEAQDSGIADARKALNQTAMDQQEDITHFQEQFNGPFPFSSNGILVLQPRASFEEEMQTKIVFVDGTIGGNQGTNLSTFWHENMHQWWGDNVSYSDHRFTFFKEGQADEPSYYYRRSRGGRGRRRRARPLGDAAFEASREPLQQRVRPRADGDSAARLLDGRAVEPDVGEPVRQPEHVHAAGHLLSRAAGDPRQDQLQRRAAADPARRTAAARSPSRSWRRCSTSTCRTRARPARPSWTSSSASGGTPPTRPAAAAGRQAGAHRSRPARRRLL